MVKIIVFDSGFGSLSIINILRKNSKNEIIYFADQKNFPYGVKTKRQLKKIIYDTIIFLKNKFKPDLIIVGSNTPSILLGAFNSTKIIGIYPPFIDAKNKTKNNSIAILTTYNVVNSKELKILIKKNIPKKIKVLKINASSLVELVESGKFLFKKQYCKNIIKNQLTKPFINNHVDVVTLSSTHLPFLLPYFQNLFPHIQFLDPAEYIVNKIQKYNKISNKSTFRIYSSGNIVKFQNQLLKLGIKQKVQYLQIH